MSIEAPIDDEVDVLVCGAGMAGLCAAATAAAHGAHPTVLEKGPRPGGSMLMSGGTIWTAPTMDVMERWVPGGDRRRQRQLIDGLAPGLAWLESLGVMAVAPIASERQVGVEVVTAELTDRLVTAVEAGGGRLVLETAVDGLETRADGRIAVATVSAGRRRTIVARSVVLATGGFGASGALTSQHFGPGAAALLVRANPHSTGDGLRAALRAGARSTDSMATFYGHTMPALPANVGAAGWVSVTQYYTQDAILVNRRGERFFDESRSMADETAAFEIVRQPDGLAWIVMDRRVHDEDPLAGRSPSPVAGPYARAAAAGAPHATADTLDALADALAAMGVDRRGLLETIAGFNRAMADGRGAGLAVPRRAAPFGLVEPPFRALAVRPGITFTLGGIDVDPGLRVLDRDGGVIPALFAAGADAGGTYDGGYMGGLVLGLVQGRAAGAAAATLANGVGGPAS